MPSRRNILRTTFGAVPVGLSGCTDRLSVGEDDTGFPSKWQTALHSPRFGTNADEEPLVVVPGRDTRNLALVGIDPETGDHEWEIDGTGTDSHELSDFTSLNHEVSLPLVTDGVVYTVTDQRYCCALDAVTGSLEWATNDWLSPTESRADSPSIVPVPMADLICLVVSVVSDDEEVASKAVGLERTAGDVRFTSELAHAHVDPPVATAGSLIVVRDDGILEAIDTEGEHRWSEPVEALVGLEAGTDTVYVSAGGNTLSAIDSADGSIRWEADFGEVTTAPSLVGDMVIVGTEGHLEAVDRPDGERLWSTPLESVPTSVSAGADRILVLGGVEPLQGPSVAHFDDPPTVSLYETETGTLVGNDEYGADDARPVDISTVGDRFFLSDGTFLSRLEVESL
ncbi:outer membrane protein assembly factor BamB family protein [Halostagnicola bangensis]